MMDEITEGSGHTVQLLPCHCKLNAIGCGWAQVRHYIAVNSATSKTAIVKRMRKNLIP
jgi:hypothetical protein